MISVCNNKHTFLREIYIETDKNKVITYISENAYNILGFKPMELLNKSLANYLSPIPNNIVFTTNFEGTFASKSGNKIDIDINTAPIIIENGQLVGLRFSLIAIAKYKNIINNKKNLLNIFECSKDFIYRLELIPEIKFTYISPSVEDVLGYSVKEHLLNPFVPLEIVHPDDKDLIFNKMNGKIDFESSKPVRYKHKNGDYIWIEDNTTPIYDNDGQLIAFQGIARNITQRKKLEEKLKKLSFYDGLTSLHNKLYLEKQIHILNTKQDTSIGVLFCDLDNLKITNDTLGHELGDKLIVYISDILKDTFKERSIISRYGGDEFIIIIKNTTLEEVQNFHSMLCNSIEKRNRDNKTLRLSVSIGYSFSETSLGVVKEVINLADKNMYKNKKKKKDCIL